MLQVYGIIGKCPVNYGKFATFKIQFFFLYESTKVPN